nr:putative uncharacterized protein FLJ44672 [Gorilla gorilla gorilla]XP_055217744.1 putative uncharacterized protein FLJ44672 [Gorilla gorilla gorilla]XP_055217745.1 putative uncharacterized protein FLJ44672 [Gorilla gorilla gorilla]XP_055217746.1 putative uncharacterized protein FLJ44672 [Gorilla gorilla gorilla]XP_055217747.1 putative uncharacterized protein FLJ44672 [Gorilla gorilla gorilla]XP_055217748.1 putative uncharacterized protein FLJ44672 [Gorilla gorilla gorilla]XP_055217749.1 pu
MAYLGPYPTSRQSPQMSLLPHNSLHRHSSIVTMASLDPAPASQPSLQALSFLKSTSPGPAHASLQPLQAQLLHLGGPSRPSLCLPSASTVATSTSQQILQAQHLPHCGSPKPSSQPFSSFYTPSSRLPVASSGPWGSFLTTAFPVPVFPFRWPLRAENLLKSASPDSLAPSRRPLRAKLFLPAASPGLTLASQQRLWTQLLPSSQQAQVVVKSAWNWARKSSKSASLGPAPSSRRPLQVQNFLESASPGPAPPASQWPLSAQTSSWLLAAFPGPAFDFWWPLQAQNLTSSGPLQARPPASRRPARARTHSGLTADSPCPASSRLIAASRVQSSCLSAASAGPAPACQWPL